MPTFVQILDFIGTFAFAISGIRETRKIFSKNFTMWKNLRGCNVSAAVFHGVSTVKNNAQSPAVIGLPRSSRSPQQKYDR